MTLAPDTDSPYIGDTETAALAHSGALDTPALRRGRLARLRHEMARFGQDAVVLVDPINVRYASGSRNMQVFSSRNPGRYLLVLREGPVVLFEFTGAGHLASHIETIDEIRPATTVSAVAADVHIDERARAWARELAELIRRHAGAGATVGVERVYAGAVHALEAEGFAVHDAQLPVERARAIKTREEIACIRASVAATMQGVARLERAIEPGASENAVWAELHAENLAHDGDYVETRLFNSGARTNPWFQESSAKRMQAGELVCLDTDVVGPYGYYSDFSRTFLCGDGRPSDHQRTLYQLAHEQIHHDAELLQPGHTFREIAEKAWTIPDRFRANRYFVLAHGCGMTGEYPYILHLQDFLDSGYDGVVEENMTLCIESYLGAPDGGEGVKLEEQYLITADGPERLSTYPFDDRLLGRAV